MLSCCCCCCYTIDWRSRCAFAGSFALSFLFPLSLARSFIARVERNTISKRQLIVWQRQIRRKFAILLIISPLYGIPRNHLYNEFKYTHMHTSSHNCCMNASEMAKWVFTNLASRILHWNSGWKMLKFNWKHGHTTKKSPTHTHTSHPQTVVTYLLVTHSLFVCFFLSFFLFSFRILFFLL